LRGPALALTALAALAACGGLPTRGASGPVGVAPGTPSDVLGAQVRVESGGILYRAELIACDGRRVYLHVNEPGDEAWVALSWRHVDRLEVRRSGSVAGAVLGTGLGVLSTASHGVFLVISAPLWILVGTGTTIGAVGDRNLELEPDEDDGLGSCILVAPYARFPAGLPESMADRYELSPRLNPRLSPRP
jgi:hypothetical protein